MPCQPACLAIAILPTLGGKPSIVFACTLCQVNCLDCHMMVDLMSLTPIPNDGPPIWFFLSIAFGWIAHADIGTERWRYSQIKSKLTSAGLVRRVSSLVLDTKWLSRKNTNAPSPPTEIMQSPKIPIAIHLPNEVSSRPGSETSTTSNTIEGKLIIFVRSYPRKEPPMISLLYIYQWINGNM